MSDKNTKWVSTHALHIFQNLETGAWAPFPGQLEEPVAGELSIGRLPKGTEEGRSTVYLRLETREGDTVVIETSLRLLWLAAKALKTAAQVAGEDVEGP